MSSMNMRVLMAALVGLGAPVIRAQQAGMEQVRQHVETLSLAPTWTSDPGSSPNRSRPMVKISQRAALKARNQRRHRMQSRGKS